ncbi:DNA topoisomerase 2-alpha [Frankliniella fusca]|uniref:DNA topoisomerase 2-alpha n=1 Tax=Frankliniella fusca TaxID=407009 RepID=A0AAE1LDM2_9NEOP|nr:DNA topoisomerase 2-alpha [Frankliniella fusca]
MEAGGAPGGGSGSSVQDNAAERERQPVTHQDQGGPEQQAQQAQQVNDEDLESQVCPSDPPDDEDDADGDATAVEDNDDATAAVTDERDDSIPVEEAPPSDEAPAAAPEPREQVDTATPPPPPAAPATQEGNSAPRSRLPVNKKKTAVVAVQLQQRAHMRKAPLPPPPRQPSRTSAMMRINQQPSHHQESFGEGIRTGPSDIDSDSEVSDAEHFLAKGAFLLTPSHELSLEKASAICERMNFSAPFSLTKTATGILFKFARPEDFQATFKKGFHKVTGARFYKKIPIPCRPQKTFTVFVLEVPEEVPEEDIRHALYKFHSVVEVVRLAGTGGPQQLTVQKDSSGGAGSTSGGGTASAKAVEKAIGSTVSGSTVELGSAGPPPLIRVTLANLDEYNILLQNGLDFYGATFFPTEAASPSGLVRLPGAAARKQQGNRILDVVTASGQRVRDLLPVFDSAGFSKIPPPAMKTIKPLKH